MAPSDRSHTTSYYYYYQSAIIYLLTFLRYLTMNNTVTLKARMSLKLIGNDTIRQITHECLLAIHSNYGPILYCF